MSAFSGKQKIKFYKRLGKDWPDLADYFEIPVATQQSFSTGEQAREIWQWLDSRNELNQLYDALDYIDRNDLVVSIKELVVDEIQSNKSECYAGNPFPGLRAFTEKETSIFLVARLKSIVDC